MLVLMTAQEARNALQRHMFLYRTPGGYPAWYVGVTADPPERCYGAHNVTPGDPTLKVCPCTTAAEARAVEQWFLARGCQGAPGGGDNTARFVYAYRIRPFTRP